MNNPESSQSPEQNPDADVVSVTDETLDQYSQLLHEIETNGADESRLERKTELENRLKELPSFTKQLNDEIGFLYRHGRRKSIADEEERTKALQDEFSVPQAGSQSGARSASKKGNANPGQPLSAKDANEQVLGEAWKNTGSELPEVTETDPEALATIVWDLNGKFLEVLYGLEHEITKNHVDTKLETQQFTPEEQATLNEIDAEYARYDKKIKNTLSRFPEADILRQESLTDVPVEDLRDMVFALRQQVNSIIEKEQAWRAKHPHEKEQ